MREILLDSFDRMTLICLALVASFFCGSALIMGGDLHGAFIGAGGIALLMLMINASIEVIIESLSDVPGLGTLVGFITNGGELLCLVVGLIAGDMLFAASVPLGSNVMNIILGLLAFKLLGKLALATSMHPRYTAAALLFTAALALGFYALPQTALSLVLWVVVAVLVSLVVFFKRPSDDEVAGTTPNVSKWWLPPMICLLGFSGYFLEPTVSFAASASLAPAGLIGFVVVALLTSWPEFKSAQTLIAKKRYLAALLNIVVSNVTNLWLASAGTIVYLMTM